MSDIDFDELDKAVNNLMKESTSEVNSPSQEAISVPSESLESATTAESSSEADVPIMNSSTPQVPVAPVTVAAPVARRRGKFMDIVAPQSSRKVSTPVRREAAVLQPTHDISMQQVPASATLDTVGTGSVVIDPQENTSISSLSESGDAPLSIENNESDLDSTPQLQDEEPTNISSDVPLISPFLPDAKVEKRPLGTPSTISLDTLDSELAKEKIEESTSTAEPDSEQAPVVTIPDEVHSEIANLEAEDTASMQAPLPAETEKKPGEVSQQTESLPTIAPETARTANESTGPTSIIQQYEEKQSSGDEHTGSIYDTNEYHQPLQHPEAKRSGIWVVILIFICILLGAAAAAVYYYFNMMQ